MTTIPTAEMIERLRAAHYKNYTVTPPSGFNLDDVADRLEQQAAEIERGWWIPVSERLPEDGERVLLYRPAFPVSIGQREGNWWDDDNWHSRVKIGEHFTHWLQIAAPPSP
jgi:hypothetical protein